MKRINNFLPFFVLILFTVSCGSKKEFSQNEILDVKCSKAVLYNEQNELGFPFISKPFRTSELSFRVGGLVKTLDIQSGNYYKKGDTIASIDRRDFIIKSDHAKAIADQTEAEYNRINALYKLNNISASIFDKAKADYHSAKAIYKTALNELSDTQLKAPFDGYIQDILFERFQEIKPSQPVCSFIDINKIKIEIYVPQDIAISVEKGDKAYIIFDAIANKKFSVEIADVSKGASKNNLSFIITAILTNPDNNLLSGMSGKMFIDNPLSKINKIAIAQTAVRNCPDKGNYVWVINKDNIAEFRNIEAGRLLKNGMIEVLNGVKEGEIVALTCIELMTAGQKIHMVQ